MVSRTHLWHKLLDYSINGKYKKRIIYQMYHGIKSLIYANNQKSSLSPCNNGVRQGDKLPPLLFSLYLNDLETYLINLGYKGVIHINGNQQNPLDIGIHLLCLLYADDTAILATNTADLQHAPNVFD